MKLHNTLTRSTEDFTPLDGSTATLYTCGPTVYDTPTIGNWTAYIRWDILARTLKSEFGLNWYMNITDVGHLVSDADEGEDKLEKGAKREGKTAWEVAEMYTAQFMDGLRELNIHIDDCHFVKATDHIEEQIELIKTLESKGFTYVIDDGVYFDSTKFPDYGKMARLDIEGLQAGARVEIGQKKHPIDFALWKFTPEGMSRDMEWDSPWGKGFPGWHIECSAMAMKYLGETLDIHTGGVDHIPVHHTNEIAQSEAATGKQFSRFWLHSNFLQVDGSKISKSLGNGYSLSDLSGKGYSGRDFRMFVLQSQFQTEANFTWEGMEAARTRLNDLQALADLRFQPAATGTVESVNISKLHKTVEESLKNNLNSPQALAALSVFANEAETKGISEKDMPAFIQAIECSDRLLGFDLLKSEDITKQQKAKITERDSARETKDWDEADAIRDELLNQGISLNDLGDRSVWRRTV